MELIDAKKIYLAVAGTRSKHDDLVVVHTDKDHYVELPYPVVLQLFNTTDADDSVATLEEIFERNVEKISKDGYLRIKSEHLNERKLREFFKELEKIEKGVYSVRDLDSDDHCIEYVDGEFVRRKIGEEGAGEPVSVTKVIKAIYAHVDKIITELYQ